MTAEVPHNEKSYGERGTGREKLSDLLSSEKEQIVVE